MSKPDGGPAFPSGGETGYTLIRGMTLRQHYAGLNMAEFYARSDYHTFADAAVDAVNAADALIAELNKETTKD